MCFTLGWLQQLCISIVVICAVVAILKLLLPWVAAQLGAAGALVAQIITIVLWAVILIAVIYFCFALISCIGGTGFPLFPHR